MQRSLIDEATQVLRKKCATMPLVGIVLGTGLNSFAEHVTDAVKIPYDQIPHFPLSTVEFHKGQLIFGTINDIPVVVMQGRFHYYEGYTLQQITFPIRVMKELGIEYLLLCNAAGGINLTFKKGDLVITEDHINLLPDNPLRGMNDEFGNRFVDMSQPYDHGLIEKYEQAFTELNIGIKKGVYVSVMGPSLETKAEYRWLRSMGADTVGMSTVPEVIVANQLGIKCAAVSVVTDECDPDNLKPVDISEILEVAGKADKKLSEVLVRVIELLL